MLLCLAALGWAADPLVRWQDTAPTVPKNAGSLTTNLVLSAAADTPVTVKWKTNTESAQAGTDFVNEANGTVHFARGEQTKSVTIAILDNPANPGGRTFGLQITNVSGGGNWGNPNYIHVTISAASVVVVATPVISPPAGTYQEAVSASATCTTSGAVLRYRLDGADPTTDDPLLAAGLTIEQPSTLSVRGFLGGVASPVAKAAYAFQIANVTASLAGGTYTGPRSVTLSTVSPGAAIHYTLNGRTPTSASLVATGPIELPGSCTLRAIAMRDGWTSSASFRASYRLIVSTPNLAPSATFAGPTRVQASSNDPLATLRYSLTRANPTVDSPQWPSEGLPISQTTTVRLGAFRNGWSNSAVVRSTYTLQVAVVVPSLPAGTYIGSRTVTLSTATPGAVIRYTLNGRNPDANSPIADGPITLPGSCTLRAQASLSGWTSSAVLRAAYVLAVPAPVLDPAAGAQPAWPLVTATADPLATVRYTLGATLPNSRSRAFPTGGLQLTGPTTVNVLATRIGWATSAVTSAAYTRNLPPAPNALSLIGDEEQSIATQATAVDSDSSALTWAVLTPPANGSITGLVASTGHFTYVPDHDFNGSDPFVLTVFDGLSTIPLTVAVTVRPINDAPVLAGLESTLGWFRDGDSALALTTALTASDPDGGNLAGATIAITGNPQAGDSLVFADQNGIAGQWNAGSATLTLSGAAPVATYQAALHSVGFLSSDAHPGTAVRTISLTVTDGALASNTLSRTIGVVTRSSPPWSEGFDGLIAGTDLHQLELAGGTRWHAWDANPGASATVSDVQARSGSNSVVIAGSTDLVHEYKGINSGAWRYSVWQYVPEDFTGTSYFILLNTYHDNDGNRNWSTQVTFSNGRVRFDFDGSEVPLVTGRWVEVRVDIDLDADVQRFYYDGVLLTQKSWTGGTSGGGALNLAAVDLYAGGASPVYYDDLSLTSIPRTPIQVQPLSVTRWSSPPHLTRTQPVLAQIWNIDVAQPGGRYHVWVNGKNGAPTIELDGDPVGQVVLPPFTAWNCRDGQGRVQTIELSAGAHQLGVTGAGVSVGAMMLVPETPATEGHEQPAIVALGAVTVLNAAGYDSVSEDTGHSWLPAADGAVQLVPKGMAHRLASPAATTGLDYQIYFAQAGTYRLWMRSVGDSSCNSAWFALDGGAATTHIGYGSEVLQWAGVQSDGSPAQLVVLTPGLHRLTMAWRQDGTSVQQLAISGLVGWTPFAVPYPVAQRSGVVQAAEDGSVVIEAESAEQLLTGWQGAVWNRRDDVAGATGSTMQAPVLPRTYTTADALLEAPAATWFVRFPGAGSYDLSAWIRAAGADYAKDSVNLGLGGPSPMGMEIWVKGVGPDLPLAWSRTRVDNSTSQLTVPGPGIYAVTLWMCESAATVDRIVLQPSDTNDPTADGPPASPVVPLVNGNG